MINSTVQYNFEPCHLIVQNMKRAPTFVDCDIK